MNSHARTHIRVCSEHFDKDKLVSGKHLAKICIVAARLHISWHLFCPLVAHIIASIFTCIAEMPIHFLQELINLAHMICMR